VAFVGISSAIACLLDLEALVTALIVIQTIIQSLAVVAAVPMLRRTRPDIARPFSMWLYPVPCVIAFAGWTYIVATSGATYILAGFGLLGLGIAAYSKGTRAKRSAARNRS
jgi:amino acid transporter